LKEFNPDAIRNLSLIGHGGSGKTTIAEYLLFKTGEINRIGCVEEGNTTSDYNKNEIEKQFSISSTPLHIEWKEVKINLLDTPGYSDLICQVINSLHVSDVAVSVIKSAEGIEVGTEMTWNFVRKNNMPAAILINKVDNEHSNFNETFEAAKGHLSGDATIISYPVNEGVNFNTVVDIIKMKEITFGDPSSKKETIKDISDDHKADAEKMREELIEKIAESDEELMEKFFEAGTLNDEELQKGIKAAILSGSLVPVFAVSATKGAGFNNFLDFVTDYFPAPSERAGVKIRMKDKDQELDIKCDSSGEPALLVFKSLSEQHVGELSIFKVFSGTLMAGMDLINTSKDKNVER